MNANDEKLTVKKYKTKKCAYYKVNRVIVAVVLFATTVFYLMYKYL